MLRKILRDGELMKHDSELRKTANLFEDELYAQPKHTAEDLQTVTQQPQPKICPCCHGAKVDKNIYGIANSKPCAVCNGTGKLRASA